MMAQKIRTIITQDAEVDDQNSLRHFLFYANEVELQGIIQTSSKFHWIGVPGAKRKDTSAASPWGGPLPDYDKPYRWPGTSWMFDVIDDYEQDYPYLCQHAEGYPSPDDLRAMTKIGNIGYEGETERSTDGSDLIKKRILDDDPRTLYIQVWGGTNTIARALMDIEEEYLGSEAWPELQAKITKKVVMTACNEQDDTYRTYIAEKWPDMQFVKVFQIFSYAYPWFTMPEGDSKDMLRSAFMKPELLNGRSSLMNGYCTWLDGHVYQGEAMDAQFGSNPEIAERFGARGGAKPQQYDFLSEGDSPTFLLFFNWGFRTLENFSFGGVSGRYSKLKDQFNSKGELLNYWDVAKDPYSDRDGNVTMTESMWPYVADIQRDFAARVNWCKTSTFTEGEHRPELVIAEGEDLNARPGDQIVLHAEARSVDADAETEATFRVYPEAGTADVSGITIHNSDGEASLTIPESAENGETIHIIAEARSNGHFKLASFRQIIITVIE